LLKSVHVQGDVLNVDVRLVWCS